MKKAKVLQSLGLLVIITIAYLLSATALAAAPVEAEVLAHPKCRVGNVYVGYIDGQNEALIDSLVSKYPKEQLTPLAIPQPIKPIPLEYTNPAVREYYKNNGMRLSMQGDAGDWALNMIYDALKKSGVRIYIYSAYRSYDEQCGVFRSKVASEMKKNKNLTVEQAITMVNIRSAFPGESEHQLGTTMDLVSDDHFLGYQLKFEFAQTQASDWLLKNAADYGFVLSYPKPEGAPQSQPHPQTGIMYEPWHWRYIGVVAARKYRVCYDKLKMPPQVFLRNLKKDSSFSCDL